MSSFSPFPVLKSDKLALRKIKVLDRYAYFKLRTNDQVNQYIDRPAPKYLKEVTQHILNLNDFIKAGDGIIWAIEITNGHNFIGTIGLRNFNKNRTKAEIGYELLPAFQKQGFMHQALKLVTEYGFNKLKLKLIEAVIHPDNLASQNLVLKSGFKENQKLKTSELLKYYVLKKMP